MNYYRAEFQPLSPYTFGTEQGLKYEGTKETGKESYIATSNYLPDQTTLLGALRFIVLRKKGLLNTDFNYDNKLDDVNAAIGNNSFRFLEKDEQTFGVIKEISPSFLWDGCSILIKNPFCNTGKDTYEPFEMEECVLTSKGCLELPKKYDKKSCLKGYDAKAGYAGGFIKIDNKETVADDKIFEKIVVPGNQIVSGNKQELKDAFYKREAVVLKKPYVFALFLKTEEEIFGNKEKHIAYMGKTGVPFEISFEKLSENEINLEEKVVTAFKHYSECWYYCLSDLLYENTLAHKSFCVVEEKYIRNLETSFFGSADYVSKRLKKERVHLISRGSVFYKEEPEISVNDNLRVAGYNVLVKLGGK